MFVDIWDFFQVINSWLSTVKDGCKAFCVSLISFGLRNSCHGLEGNISSVNRKKKWSRYTVKPIYTGSAKLYCS